MPGGGLNLGSSILVLDFNLLFQFLQYYPPEEGELPYNGFTPEEMPEHAWFNFWAMRQYPDLTNEEMGIPNLGEPNVTFPDWKVMEKWRGYASNTNTNTNT